MQLSLEYAVTDLVQTRTHHSIAPTTMTMTMVDQIVQFVNTCVQTVFVTAEPFLHRPHEVVGRQGMVSSVKDEH